MRLKYLVSILFSMVFAFYNFSCVGTHNGDLQIHNDTDKTVRVYYSTEESEYDESDDRSSTVTVDYAVNISAGITKTLEIESDDFAAEGKITAVYGGIVKKYSFEFDSYFFGEGEIFLTQEEFYNQIRNDEVEFKLQKP